MIKFLPKKIFNILKKNCPWVIGGIFVLLISINIFIYYQYVYLTIKTQPELTSEEILINEEMFQKVQENTEKREDTLSRVKETKYYNPFND
ncbi:MAG: hypothetical protein ISS02_00340 [Candidatus Portnoybacteria bacterium]|nr:hypothetical protein [Candidatus Portnoybacteria bacterium]